MGGRTHKAVLSEALRQAAEERLQVRSLIGNAPLPPHDLQRMVHELQVHQIELEMQNEALKEALARVEDGQRFIDLYELATVAYFSVSADSTIQLMNAAAGRLLGLDRNRLKGQRLIFYVDDVSLTAFTTFLGKSFESKEVEMCELKLHCKGRKLAVEVRLEAVTDHKGGLCNLAVTDITDRKRMEAQVHRLAFHDSLTNLPNRRLLDDRLSQAMAASKRTGCKGALMFLDLDNFKALNDKCGHAVGDLLLIEAARRLNACVREMDTVARFGGDEFVVIISELKADQVEPTAQAGVIADKIRSALAEPYVLVIKHGARPETRVQHQCSASIGIVLFRGQDASKDEILKWADSAMYKAKAAGGNRYCFYADAC